MVPGAPANVPIHSTTGPRATAFYRVGAVARRPFVPWRGVKGIFSNLPGSKPSGERSSHCGATPETRSQLRHIRTSVLEHKAEPVAPRPHHACCAHECGHSPIKRGKK